MSFWSNIRKAIYTGGGGTALTAAYNWLTSGYVDWVNLTYHFAPVDLRALWAGTAAVTAASLTALIANLKGWGSK